VSSQGIVLVVAGSMNTDIVALGVERLLAPGEQTRSGRLLIGPGGKACNMARMAAALLGPRKVAMLARTTRDPYGLWKVPLKALEDTGVETRFIKIEEHGAEGEYPGIALIAVDSHGEHQIYSVPGISATIGPRDIDEASALFAEATGAHMLSLTLDLPLQTAVHAVRKASSSGMKVVLDPGGLNESDDHGELLRQGISLLKPNEHEARVLSGVEVVDFATAREAARILRGRGVGSMVLTHGENGAYVFTTEEEKHIPAPLEADGGIRDATGCGDQVTAVLCVELLRGKDLLLASEAAVLAGTLQYQCPGIKPVTIEEMEAASTREERP
jgi:ribokinase